MNIDRILIPPSREAHIGQAHQVHRDEVYDAFEDDDIQITRAQDDRPDHSGRLYVAFGRAENGRLLTVIFRYFPDDLTAYVITARDMTVKEKRQYRKKG